MRTGGRSPRWWRRAQLLARRANLFRLARGCRRGRAAGDAGAVMAGHRRSVGDAGARPFRADRRAAGGHADPGARPAGADRAPAGDPPCGRHHRAAACEPGVLFLADRGHPHAAGGGVRQPAVPVRRGVLVLRFLARHSRERQRPGARLLRREPARGGRAGRGHGRRPALLPARHVDFECRVPGTVRPPGLFARAQRERHPVRG